MNLTAVQVQTIDGVPAGARHQTNASTGLMDAFAQIVAGMTAMMQEQGENGVQVQAPVSDQKKPENEATLFAALQMLASQPALYRDIPAAEALEQGATAEGVLPPAAEAQLSMPVPVPVAAMAAEQTAQPVWITARRDGPRAFNMEALSPKDNFGGLKTEMHFDESPVVQAEFSGETQGESRQDTETLYTAQRQFRSTVDLVKSRLQKQQDDGSAEEINVDQLQGQVDAQKAFGTATVKKAEAAVAEPKLLEQLSTGIAEKLQKGESEFTLRLKPQELGEITVKLIEKAGKTTISIVTASTQTAKLINADLSSLREALRPMQVEVQDAVQHTGETSQSFLNFDMSGGQRFSDGRQAFNEKQPLYYGRPEDMPEAEPEEELLQNQNYIMM